MLRKRKSNSIWDTKMIKQVAVDALDHPTTIEHSIMEHSSTEPVAPLPTSPLALTHIYEPQTNIAVWQRTLDSDIQAVANRLIQQDEHFQLRISGSLAGISKSLFEQLSHIDECELLIADVVVLVDMFAELFELDRVGLRMTVLTKAMCPKFHVDRVPCRLITTYQGSATQWLDNQHVVRNANGSIAKANKSAAQQAQAGAVCLLKGESWLGNEGRGVAHRSPPTQADSPRLVLTLDFA